MPRSTTSSSKEKARRSRPETARRPAWRIWALGGALLTAMVALVLFRTRERPEQLLRAGERQLTTDPTAAAQLLERSVAAAGGNYPAAQLLLSEALGRQGRWVEALGCFTLIQDKSGLDGRQLMSLSSAAVAGGELILAEQALTIAGRSSVPAVEVLSALIPVRVQLGYDEPALADCQRLAKLAPELVLPHIVEARLRRRRREVLDAETAYRSALARSKDPAETVAVRRELVELLIQTGNGVEARREFDLIRGKPGLSDSVPLLAAYILRLEGASQAALEQANRYLTAHPDHADALLLRGTLHSDLGEFELAAADLRRRLEINPYDNETHYLLSRAYLKLHKPAEARTHRETSQRLAGMAAEIRALEERAARRTDDAQVYRRLAELYDATGRPAPAARCRQIAAQLDAA